MIALPAIQAPAVEPKLANAVTSKTLPTLFFQNKDKRSSLRNDCKSLVDGAATFSCIKPANHPAANIGFRDVIGLAIAAVRIDSG